MILNCVQKEQRRKKYWCPVLKYNITFGIKSPKCLVSCLFRLILFALGNKALFEIDYAKIKIHAPFNSNSCCTFRGKRRSIQKKMMTLFHTPPPRELDLVPLNQPPAVQAHAEQGYSQCLPQEGLQATSPALRRWDIPGEQRGESRRVTAAALRQKVSSKDGQ